MTSRMDTDRLLTLIRDVDSNPKQPGALGKLMAARARMIEMGYSVRDADRDLQFLKAKVLA